MKNAVITNSQKTEVRCDFLFHDMYFTPPNHIVIMGFSYVQKTIVI